MDRCHYVYKITHEDSGCWYIGIRSSSKAPLEDRYMGSGTVISELVSEAPEEFTKRILVQVETREEAERLEAALVTQEQLDDPLCLNLALGGGKGPLGMKFGTPSDDVRRRIGDAHRGKAVSDETRRKRAETMKALWASGKFDSNPKPTGGYLPGEDQAEMQLRVACERATAAATRWLHEKYRELGIGLDEDLEDWLHAREQNLRRFL